MGFSGHRILKQAPLSPHFHPSHLRGVTDVTLGASGHWLETGQELVPLYASIKFFLVTAKCLPLLKYHLAGRTVFFESYAVQRLNN